MIAFFRRLKVLLWEVFRYPNKTSTVWFDKDGNVVRIERN